MIIRRKVFEYRGLYRPFRTSGVSWLSTRNYAPGCFIKAFQAY